MDKKNEEPVMGIPYQQQPPYPPVYAPQQQQQYYVGNNPHQSGQIPPNAVVGDPKGIPLLQTIYRDTPAPINCAFCGSSGLTTVREKLLYGNMATIRNLKIKTASCKRIVKELHSYEKEVEREAAKTADMKEKAADPYDLKQQENVLGESRMMIPDCRKRLESSLADLKGILAELEEANQKEGPEVTEAETTVADVEKLFETTES